MEDLITIRRQDLLAIVEMASDRSAAKFAQIAGLGKSDMISQSKAFQEFGESFVKRMIRQKEITGDRRGDGNTSKIIFSRSKLQVLKKADSVATLK